jgi:CrcB protein
VGRLALVALGGLLGSFARHVATSGSGDVPWAVLWVNLAGALMAGVLVARVRRHATGSTVLLPLAVVGVAGALTTFSGLAVDTVLLIDAGQVGDALRYSLASLGLGPLVAGSGLWIGART